MKSLAFIRALGVCLLFSGAASTDAFGAYGGGDGSESVPFLISEPAHITALGLSPEDWTKYFKLTGDIDMGGIAHAIIGEANSPFYGVFDGDGFVIRNMNGSLFYRINVGTVKNLGLVNVTTVNGALVQYQLYYGTIDNCYSRGVVQSNGTDLGGLVGVLTGGTISNSYTAGEVRGGANSQRVGGLVGMMESGTIIDCYSSATVTAGVVGLEIGGLTGRMHAGTLTGCYSLGVVQGVKYVGGLVGRISTPHTFQSTVSTSFSAAAVTIAEGSYGNECGGGLVGYLEGTGTAIVNCYSTGPVTASANSSKIGGLAGWMLGGSTITDSYSVSEVRGGVNSKNLGGLAGSQDGGSIRRCYSAGIVTGETGSWYLGGLVGMQYTGSRIYDSYSCAAVTGASNSRCIGGLVGYLGNDISAAIEKCFAAGPVGGGYDFAGGLVGQNFGSVTTSFWDKEATGQSSSAGGKGKTTAEMQDGTTFSSAGWDFADVWAMHDYPGLAWQPALAADGVFSAQMTPGEQATIAFDIYSLTEETIRWTVSGYAACGWITGVGPAAGVSAGPDDRTAVCVTVDAAGLESGDYCRALTLTGDNGDVVRVLISLHVFDRVNLEEFALLGSYWGTTACLFGQPCKDTDWCIDGNIDVKDLVQLADGWLQAEVEVFRPTVEDGFETGDFSLIDWQQGGDIGWMTSSGGYDGVYAAKSGTIGNGGTSVLYLTLDTTGWDVDAISFFRKVSSEGGYDYLRFSIDGVEQNAWSGELPNWTLYTYTITPGLHTFRWSYTKDSDGFGGQDCGWIDAVRVYKR